MTVTADQSQVRNGLLEHITRHVHGGIIDFEYAPRGYLKRNGEPRLVDHRAYFWTPTQTGKRERVVSVTTLLGSILSKDALITWSEAKGIEGAVEAMRRGEIPEHVPVTDAPSIVRDLNLGADAAKNKAAGRGINLHSLLERYMLTGDVPNVADHPAEQAGYLQALCSWLLERNPMPESVEQLVCSPTGRYAGRRDLVAMCGGVRIGFDAKTQERAGIYTGAHLQLRLYEQAARECGDPPCDELRIVVFAADGKWREMPCEADAATALAALSFYSAIKPIDATCESFNRAERKARK